MCIVNLENEKHKWLIDVDYSLPIAEVFTRAARYSILSERSLEILSYKEHGSDIPGLPSWVPDWTCQNLYPIGRITMPLYYRSQFHDDAWPNKDMGRMKYVKFILFYHTRNKTCATQFNNDGKTISTLGYTIDVVKKVSSIWQSAILEANETTFHKWAHIHDTTTNSNAEATTPPSTTTSFASFKAETPDLDYQ